MLLNLILKCSFVPSFWQNTARTRHPQAGLPGFQKTLEGDLRSTFVWGPFGVAEDMTLPTSIGLEFVPVIHESHMPLTENMFDV
jgi:hypothetical protein